MNKTPHFNYINKASLLLLLILFLSSQLSAQKNTWTVGVNAGVKQELNSISQNYRYIILGQNDFSPQAGFQFSYYFHDNFAIESGLSYSSTKLPALVVSTLKHANVGWNERVPFMPSSTLYHSIQVPALLSSSFSIWKNLKFYAKTGLCLNFMIQDNDVDIKRSGELTGTSIKDGITYQHLLDFDVEINTAPTAYELLLNAGIGIGYEFPMGLGISFNASFAQGFIITTDVLTSYGYIWSSTEHEEFFTSGYENISYKTNYYSLTLGIFYKINSNKK
ncbi:MAG: PorT family protein [Bacteroidales bacterium]|jgi:hypothetical protein|nr:PorT family protein [Bacteroidales bacterium]